MTNTLTASGRAYVVGVIAAGVAVVLHSLHELWHSPVNYQWFVLACLTLLSGSFTIRIPTIPARLSVSETFVFAAVLLFGPAAATLVVVLDTLIISLWLAPASRRPTRVLFNMAAPAVAIWAAAHVFYILAAIEPLSQAPQQILGLLLPLFILAFCYFLLNSGLVAFAVAFEKQTTAFSVWRRNFLWLSLNYFSGASVAALLLPYLQSPESQFVRVIGVILPLLLISYLTFKTALGRVEDANIHLRELNKLYLSTIETLAMAIDAKDQITHGHIRRVQIHAVRLAKAVGVTEPAQIQAIEAAALLHDMGKLAVPEYILNKPGPLTPAEFERMKLHATVGADILSAIDFPYPVVPIVRHHHENWDGTGYPSGLAGSDIPIGARILSVVDCFDALTSDRPYRPRLSDTEALRILQERRGTMYDPLIVDAFIEIHPELKQLADAARVPSRQLASLSASFGNRPSYPPKRAHLEEISASRAETMVLLELAQQLGVAEGPRDIADAALHHVRRLIPASLALLFVRGEGADDLHVLEALGDNSTVASELSIRLGQQLSGWVGANRHTIRNSDALLDFGDAARAMSPRPISAMAAAIVADELVGVLSVYSTLPDAFTADHERVLEAVAHHIAKPLRTALTAKKGDETARASRKAASTRSAVVYVHVEGLTDQSHHTARSLSTTISHCIRSKDVVLRLGDQEYAVVLADASIEAAATAARRIQAAGDVWRQSVGGGEPKRIRTTYAVGPEDGRTPDALLNVARLRALNDEDPLHSSSPTSSVH
ncbi:MAG TPA: HD domain-containing phosphohydrolase [Vicinamibacterales bacterium]|nr:HD domain-containing phosphohydrolase [Vicinamibacterales bacterium]